MQGYYIFIASSKGLLFRDCPRTRKMHHVTQRSRAPSLQNHFSLLTLRLPLKNANYLTPMSENNSLHFINSFLSSGYLFNLESCWASHAHSKCWHLRVGCRARQARFQNGRPSRTTFLSQQAISAFLRKQKVDCSRQVPGSLLGSPVLKAALE